MKSLYVKILAWSILTIAVSLGVFSIGARSAADRSVREQGNPFMRMLAMQADDARDAYETGGPAKLAAYLARLHQFMGAERYLVDSVGRDLVTGESRGELLAKSRQSDGRPVPSEEGFLITKGTVGGKYHLIAIGPPPLSPWAFAPYFVLVLAVIALLCWVLAITIASPLRRMANAVDRFGRGDLSVRLRLQRKDEVGELARAFDTMADRLQTLMTAERRLLQDVSHELRSPLARLSFAAELVKTAPDRSAAVARMCKEIDRLTELVSALLQMTRAEGDPAAQCSELIALGELVQHIAEDCRLEAAARDCRIVVNIVPETEVVGDPELVRRAVENVVRNAIRYSPDNSSIEVNLSKDQDAARITVRDYGPGVPEQALGQISRPFYRVDDSRNGDTGGVGLGLAIACRAVQLHRGAIRAVNANPGLLVLLELPLTGAHIRQAAVPAVVKGGHDADNAIQRD